MPLKHRLRPLAERFPAIHKYRHPWRQLTAHARVLPDFVLIGAQKSGTTTLYDLLCLHPRVLRASYKEPAFFSFGFNWRHGESWYRKHFPTRYRMGAAALTGEASTSYLLMPAAPVRMRRVLPDARLLVILRNPVDRAYSEYHMNVARGLEHGPFADAVRRDPGSAYGRLESDPEDDGHLSRYSNAFVDNTYLLRGQYARHLRRWFRHYGRDRFLVLTSEELRADRQRTCDRCFRFLGLEPSALPPAPDSNVGRYPPMDRRTRRFLAEYFRPHNAELESLLGLRFGWDP